MVLTLVENIIFIYLTEFPDVMGSGRVECAASMKQNVMLRFKSVLDSGSVTRM